MSEAESVSESESEIVIKNETKNVILSPIER